jgi:hypothetical protein
MLLGINYWSNFTLFLADTNNRRLVTIVLNTDTVQIEKNSENEFRYIHFNSNINNQTQIRITTFTI